MRAITCTQCGATIEEVSETSVIIHCSYCGARIMIDRAQPAPAPTPRIFDEPPSTFESNTSNQFLKIVSVVVGAVVLIPLFVGVFLINKKDQPRRAYSAPSTSPSTYPVPGVWSASTEPVKQTPVVNYQPRVSWDGPNDMQYFADPEVDISSVSDLSSEEVKKTVFKNRIVKLRVIINTEGEIDEVVTISGHPLLVAAATESAKRSIFTSRSKPTTRILTYTFRVLKD